MGKTPPPAPCHPAFASWQAACIADVPKQMLSKVSDTMKTAATNENLTVIDNKNPTARQELIAANIKLLID
jgi:hypothetical protein